MKKLIAIIITFALVLALAGCGGRGGATETDITIDEPEAEEAETALDEPEKEVVYSFEWEEESASVTGDLYDDKSISLIFFFDAENPLLGSLVHTIMEFNGLTYHEGTFHIIGGSTDGANMVVETFDKGTPILINSSELLDSASEEVEGEDFQFPEGYADAVAVFAKEMDAMLAIARPDEQIDPADKPSAANPAQIPEAVIYTGTGDSVIDIEPVEGAWVLYVEGNQDSKHFSVKGYDADGNYTELFVNTTDPYVGITVDADQATSMLEISATGDWTIECRSMFSCRSISEGETVDGNGDEIIRILGHGSTAVITGNNDSHYFSVKSFGTTNNLMVNTTDMYSGEVMIKGEPLILQVSAAGNWSITF